MPSPLAKLWLAFLKLNHRSRVIRFCWARKNSSDAPENKCAPENCRNQLPQAGRMCSAQGTRGKLWYSPLSINTKSTDSPLMVYLYSMNEQICPYPLLLNNSLAFTVNSNWITSKFWVQPENINAALFPGHILITVICGILSNWVHNLTCLLQPSYHRCCQ